MAREYSVLLVEDEVIVALDIELTVAAAGLRVDAHAVRGSEALELFERHRPDLCLVDLQLLDGPVGIDCGRRFAEAGALVVFMTANHRALPEDLCGACGVIAKPYTNAGLLAALDYLRRRLAGEALPEQVPAALELFAPALAGPDEVPADLLRQPPSALHGRPGTI